jgi:2-oxoglutarate dehydrogenase E2 component (dihydrolipoamide succinyltransferase)
MSIEVKVPNVGESISEVQIAEWLKAEGDAVTPDETVATLDTDKTTVEVPAPGGGILSKILKKSGETAQVGDVIAILEEGAGASTSNASTAAASTSNGAGAVPGDAPPSHWKEGEAKVAAGVAESSAAEGNEKIVAQDEQKTVAPPSGPEVTTTNTSNAVDAGAGVETGGSTGGFVMPAAQRILEQNGVDAASVAGTGPDARVLKQDAQSAVDSAKATPAPQPQAQAAPPAAAPAAATAPAAPTEPTVAGEDEEVVPMTRLRATIARHLVSAQQNAALLTTFNEIDMSAVMAMRKEIQEAFTKKHGVKLGFMSFFIKASIDALKMYPGINAEIRGPTLCIATTTTSAWRLAAGAAWSSRSSSAPSA